MAFEGTMGGQASVRTRCPTHRLRNRCRYSDLLILISLNSDLLILSRTRPNGHPNVLGGTVMGSVAIIEALRESFVSHVDVKTLFGEPVEAYGKTIIPVAKVGY